MKRSVVTAVSFLSLIASGVVMNTSAQEPNGETVYRQACAGCHDRLSPRIPPRIALEQMSAARILRALDFGVMMTVAYPLRRDEREAVAKFLGRGAGEPAPPASAFCADRRVTLEASSKSAWIGWSPTSANTRFQPSEAAMLAPEQVKRLDLKWAFAFDGDLSAFAQPTVVGHNLFVGSAGGVVHALDTETGCIHWRFQANGPVRSAIVVVPLGRKQALLFSDLVGWVYTLDAATGAVIWKKRVDDHEATRLTGAAAIHNGTVFIPVASWEETRALGPAYPCCTFRGSIVALRASDGSLVWKQYTIRPEAKLVGTSRTGAPQWGPSGAGVWATPTLDVKRGLLYVTTGDNYSSPPTDTSDSVMALELKTGQIVWSRQMTKGDAYNSACGSQTANCPAENGPDFDFGSPALFVRVDGRDRLIAGQKSGMVYALDPANGELVWQTRVGKGGVIGGVQWGMASDDRHVYAAVSDVARILNSNPNDPARSTLNPAEGGGLTALDLKDGHKSWYAAPPPCSSKPGCSPAQSQAVTAIPGVVFSGSLDGHLRAYATADGGVLWDFNTVREYRAANGAVGHGGSLDGPGPVIAGGMVFVTSGYSRFGGMPGNVLLAFAPR